MGVAGEIAVNELDDRRHDTRRGRRKVVHIAGRPRCPANLHVLANPAGPSVVFGDDLVESLGDLLL